MPNCEDFKTEITAMHELMELLGIGMEQTPKGHPELAGRGIEYYWGKSKYEFRKHNNFVSGKENFEKRVMNALNLTKVGDAASLASVSAQGKRLQPGLPHAHRWVRCRGRGAVCRHRKNECNERSREKITAARLTMTKSLSLSPK